MNETATSIKQTAERLGLTMQAVFVPWSESRNAGSKQPCLNWKITLVKNGKPFLTTDYMAGSGHCPSYNQQWYGKRSVWQKEAIESECETGRTHRDIGIMMGKPILPDLADVLHSLCSDAQAIDCGTFEEWADSYGLDVDSRKSEAIYRACLEIGLKLRNALGEKDLQKLREAMQDY